MKNPVLKVAAQPYTQIGDLIRYPHAIAKFWKVARIEGGKAICKPAGFGTDCRVACC